MLITKYKTAQQPDNNRLYCRLSTSRMFTSTGKGRYIFHLKVTQDINLFVVYLTTLSHSETQASDDTMNNELK
jgi:hypothetical protein